MDIIKLLLDHQGGYVSHTDNEYDPLIVAACEYGQLEVVKLLRKRSNVPFNESHLAAACKKGHAHIVSCLLMQEEDDEVHTTLIEAEDSFNESFSCRVFLPIMKELGLPIVRYANDFWELNDCLQPLSDYDCLTVHIVKFRTRDLFFDAHDPLVDPMDYFRGIQLDFQFLLTADIMEVALNVDQTYARFEKTVQKNVQYHKTRCDEVWALIDMGMFDLGSSSAVESTILLLMERAHEQDNFWNCLIGWHYV